MGSIRLPSSFITVNQYEKRKDFVYFIKSGSKWYPESANLKLETFFERKADPQHGDHHTPLPYHRISAKAVYPVGLGSGWGIYGRVEVLDYPNNFNLDIPPVPLVPDIYNRRVVNPSFTWDDNTMNSVRTRAVAGLAGDNMNLGASLAEAGETASYIAQKASVAFGMLRAIKKGNLSAFRKYFKTTKGGSKIKARHISKTAAERWLEWKYAVVPLCSDIQSGIQLFSEGIVQNRAYDRPWEIKSKARQVVTFDRDFVPATGSRYEDKTVATYYCAVYATISDADAYAAAQLGLNIPSAAWELVPFSFVLDWAVPIGTFLQALYATDGLTFSRGFVTIKWNTTWRARYTYTTPPFRFIPEAYGGVLGMVRMPQGAFPVPRVFYKSPFSTSNIITSLALFRVLFMK